MILAMWMDILAFVYDSLWLVLVVTRSDSLDTDLY